MLSSSDCNNLPAMQETLVQPLDQEDSLEKEMEVHSSILAWKIPWTEETCKLLSMGSQRVEQDWVINTFTSLLKEKFFFSFFSFLRICSKFLFCSVTVSLYIYFFFLIFIIYSSIFLMVQYFSDFSSWVLSSYFFLSYSLIM